MPVEIIREASEEFNRDGKVYQDFYVKDEFTGDEIIRRYVKNEDGNWEVSPIERQRISLSKKAAGTTRGVDLAKHSVNLNKTLVSLAKSTKVDIIGHQARVALAIDNSPSMIRLYTKDRSGTSVIQRLLDRLIPVSMEWDDNGELETWSFNHSFKQLETLTLDNYSDYVETVMHGERGCCGGTSYSPILTDVYNYYTKENKLDLPTFVIFLTDGECFDYELTREIVIKLSGTKTYILMVPITSNGCKSFPFIEELSKLDGRACNNIGVFKVDDFDKMSDEELYNAMFKTYIDWLAICDEKIAEWKETHVDEEENNANNGSNSSTKKKGFFAGLKSIFGLD